MAELLLLSLCFGAAQGKHVAVSAGGAFIQMRSDVTDVTTFSKMRFIGRWYPEGNVMKHSWGTGTFMVRFRGSASLGASLQSPTYQAPHYYVCQVDEGPDIRLPHSSGTLVIAEGLSPSEHTIKCGRSSEASYGTTTLAGVVLDSGSEVLPLDASSHLRYEAIGDSITAGFKVTGTAQEQATPRNEDVFKTYERHLADAWGTSDWRVVAKSGISILPYLGGAEKVMELEFPCRTFWADWQGSCPIAWDFEDWQADVVSINLGTNDFAFGDAVTKASFQKGYKDLVVLVRSKYPKALILCIQPLQYSCGGGSAKLQAIVEGLEAAVEEMQQSGDRKVRYHTTGTMQSPWLDCQTHYSDFTHPTVEGNEIFAERLLETLTNDVRFFFPEKCSGSGPRCNGAVVTTAPSSTTTTTTASTTATADSSTTASTTATAGSESACVARPQSSLPSGSWATTDSYCANCANDGSVWPCDTDPLLCDCSPQNVTTSVSVTVPTTTLATLLSTTAPEDGSATCVARPQSELPSGSWATTDAYCVKCAIGYEWWPCDSVPSLCDCSPQNVTTSVSVTVPTTTLAPLPTTTAPEDGSTTCAARPQSELPSGSWATTDAYCAKCATGYEWWPCDSQPELCSCSR
eukprot:CAMPEP_0197657408 /NCGR_PEP_ID=MMETSP1338-20131121/44606_1 /TAXON_ID=43686 ORGANISM="Pelagodinium beii, Strain RCC1491" /NCGR_SAMPLE_ID=MMETSP1338 /ASSEMBLY_ACC=CAM_ASM_000754 /LENGTH=630 /DNA_ID=CAMNT_0043233767 /DNA_START=42 /DNA_END=1934 /DNA_ORIENTATION=-